MWNWLFGPEMDQRGGWFGIRSRKLGLDAVRAVIRTIEQAPGGGRPQLLLHERMMPQAQTPVNIDELDKLSDAELLRLVVYFHNDDGSNSISVDFRERQGATLSANGQLLGIADNIVRYLQDEGSPRVRWAIVKALPAALSFLSVVAVGVILLVIEPFEGLSQNALAAGVVLLVAGLVSEATQRKWNERFQRTQRNGRGHRIIAITREQLRLNRANTHRDLKIGLPIALVSVALGTALGAWLGC